MFKSGYACAVVCLVLTLHGCASTHRNVTAHSISGELSIEPELGKLVEGDSGRFYSDGGLLSPLGQVTIGREYRAASGRLCKRILNENGEQLLSVICKAADDRWYMRQLF